MNQVNPLQIGVLLVVVLSFLFFNLGGIKEELKDAKSEFKESEKLSIELSSLKDVYANKKKSKRDMDRLLAHSSLKKANLDIKRTKTSVNVSSKSIESSSLNYLMGKVLNGSYNISILKIKRLSDTNAALNMEIKW